jgi:hypothetical protein
MKTGQERKNVLGPKRDKALGLFVIWSVLVVMWRVDVMMMLLVAMW